MFKQWIAQLPKGGKHTHLMMDGGRFTVPSEYEEEFSKRYVEAVNNGEKLYIVEQKTSPVFNFFVDLDYKDYMSLTEEKLTNMVKIICNCVKRVTDVDKPCTVSISDQKEDRGKLKNGVHMVWRGVHVDKVVAMSIRKFVIDDLKSVYLMNDWDSIVDEAVYKGSGMRIPWSYKRVVHRKCGGKGCMDCELIGKVDEGQYYPVFRVLEGGDRLEVIDPEEGPTVQKLDDSSIRCHGKEVNVNVEEVDFANLDISDEGKFHVINDPTLKFHLDEFIQNNVKGHAKTKISRILHNNKRFFLKTTSHVCENLVPPRTEHKSHHIWFSVNKCVEIRQRCFCRCPTTEGRRYGLCEKFQGTPYTVNETIQNLFKANVVEEEKVTNVEFKKNCSDMTVQSLFSSVFEF